MCECKTIGRRSLLKGALAGTALGGLSPWCLSGCSVNPATGQSSFTGFMSADDERRVGSEQYPVLVKEFGGEYQDARLKSYLNSLGNELLRHTETPDRNFTFTVVNSDIVNAFALPGGYVCISRGLMAICQNEAELAGVVGHEIGHVVARHSAQSYSSGMAANIGLMAAAIGLSALGAGQAGQGLMNAAQYGAQAFLQSYSREHEMEADLLGQRYMTRSGYEPEAMVNFLDLLRKHSMLQARMAGRPESSVDQFDMMATHPQTRDRVAAADQRAKTQRPTRQPVVNRGPYLDVINGMLFGDDPDQGMMKGRSFMHPGLRFAFDVPDGFRLSNSPSKVVASNPKGAAIIFDGAKPRGSGTIAAYLTREWVPRANLSQVETISVNGMDAATGITQGQAGGQPVYVRLLAVRYDAGQIYRFMFVTPRSQSHLFDEDFKRTTYSFRRLSSEEAAGIKPLRLIVVKAHQGDTAERLSSTMPFKEFNPDWFKLLNDIDQGQPLNPGQTIKVVAG